MGSQKRYFVDHAIDHVGSFVLQIQAIQKIAATFVGIADKFIGFF